MKPVLRASEMRDFERALIASGREDELTLMERAARALAETVLERYRPATALIVCGGGNNGGDGLAAARLLRGAGVEAAVLLAAEESRLGESARAQLRRWNAPVYREFSDLPEGPFDCVVDALFGTGLSRPVSARHAALIERVQALGAPVIAADMPSGVDGGSGRVLGAALKADLTLSFQWLKTGQIFEPGRSYAGECLVRPIFDAEPPAGAAVQFEEEDAARLLPPRPADSHKGRNGRLLLCAGSTAYTGAALLAAAAALRAGAGITSAAVPRDIKPAFVALPEVCCLPVGGGGRWDKAALAEAAALVDTQDALALGCGMGVCEDASLLEAMLTAGKPLVIDADGLNLLAAHPPLLRRGLHAGVVLTPHPAEMARLCGREIGGILADPMAAAAEAAESWGCTLLLKGAVSCVAHGGRTVLIAAGNSGLAKG
ncbi:MAG: NAD(P)H-hydrate dehydratase, partial [Clostridia bacterium]|nr:NAD(P)H-hydrate dehydratase [Clostridia bacterium]